LHYIHIPIPRTFLISEKRRRRRSEAVIPVRKRDGSCYTNYSAIDHVLSYNPSDTSKTVIEIV
jgi:hypothetical protein